MPRLMARAPERRGSVAALRSRAAAVVAPSAGRLGLWAKRSGRGVLMDLMDRRAVVARNGEEEVVEEGRRKGGGRRPQLRGGLGGMAAAALVLVVTDLWCCSSRVFWAAAALAPRRASQPLIGSLRQCIHLIKYGICSVTGI